MPPSVNPAVMQALCPLSAHRHPFYNVSPTQHATASGWLSSPDRGRPTLSGQARYNDGVSRLSIPLKSRFPATRNAAASGAGRGVTLIMKKRGVGRSCREMRLVHPRCERQEQPVQGSLRPASVRCVARRQPSSEMEWSANVEICSYYVLFSE